MYLGLEVRVCYCARRHAHATSHTHSRDRQDFYLPHLGSSLQAIGYIYLSGSGGAETLGILSVNTLISGVVNSSV